MKRYWKLLLVPANQLDFEHFHKWTNFPYWITATDVVDHLLSLDPEFKQTYQILNNVHITLQHKDWNNYNAAFWHLEGCSEEMHSTTIKVLQEHHEEIRHTFLTTYTNGALVGSNNKIKIIKRVSYGYRSFFRFRIRILYAFRVKTKKVLITK
ncbi:transposase [Pediococcus siamensis]|uniref:transposase n=1 Tax=Pediococcus siamensis TaxID=381829 RepID=UPI0039A3494C